MDWNASLAWILAAAFALGALHALEPGHGKSIMGAYLIAAHGGIRHAVLLGLVVTVTHTFVVFLLALGTLYFAAGFAPERTTFWLEIVSGALVLTVGAWMSLTSFGLLRRRGGTTRSGHEHSHPHPDPHVEASHDPHHAHVGERHSHDHHAHGHPHEHGAHSHEHHHGHSHEVKIPEGRNPLGVWTLLGVGASGGLVPCPAALTALLAAVNLGRTAEGIAVVGAMSLGIAAALIGIGIVFVQASRFAMRFFGEHSIVAYAPRVSAVLITVLGVGLVFRAFLGAGH